MELRKSHTVSLPPKGGDSVLLPRRPSDHGFVPVSGGRGARSSISSSTSSAPGSPGRNKEPTPKEELISLRSKVQVIAQTLQREITQIGDSFSSLAKTVQGAPLYELNTATLEEWSERIVELAHSAVDAALQNSSAVTDAVDPTLRITGKKKVRRFDLQEVVRAVEKQAGKAPAKTAFDVPLTSAGSGGVLQPNKPPPASYTKTGPGSTFMNTAAVGEATRYDPKSLNVAASLHVLLDSTLRATQSEKASIYVPYRGDVHDLVSICAVGYGPDTNLPDLRLRDPNSVPSMTLQTGMLIAVCRGHNPAREVQETLDTMKQFLGPDTGSSPVAVSPISGGAEKDQQRPRSSGTDGGDPSLRKGAGQSPRSVVQLHRAKYWSGLSVPIRMFGQQKGTAVLHIVNKNYGNSNYDPEDEHFVHGVAQLIASIFEREDDFDLLAKLYDPQLHLPPVTNVNSLIRGVSPRGCREQLVFHTWDTAHGKDVKILAPADEKTATKLDDTTPLVWVSSYIEKLQHMWKESVLTNMEFQRAHQDRTAFVKRLVDRVRVAELRNEVLRTELQKGVVVEGGRPSWLTKPNPLDPQEWVDPGVGLSAFGEGEEEREGDEKEGVERKEGVEEQRGEGHQQKAEDSTTTAEDSSKQTPRSPTTSAPDNFDLKSASEALSQRSSLASRALTMVSAETQTDISGPLVTDSSFDGATDSRTGTRKAPQLIGFSSPLAGGSPSTTTSPRARMRPQTLTTMDKETRQSTYGKKNKPKYRMGNLIGTGAHGTVYLAFIEDTGESVAAKKIVMNLEGSTLEEIEQQMQSLQVEVNLLKALDHPYIVRYLFTDKIEGQPFVPPKRSSIDTSGESSKSSGPEPPTPPRSPRSPGANVYSAAQGERGVLIFMEFVAGGSIAEIIGTYGMLPERTAAVFAAQLLLGLEYLHANEVVHRDVKPANCLVTVLGDIKLSDFGTALMAENKRRRWSYPSPDSPRPVARTDDVRGSPGITDTPSPGDTPPSPGGFGLRRMSVAGTPLYMAPEVIRREGCSWQADIWSFGCTLMEMVTGDVPWKHLDCSVKEALRFVVQRDDKAPPVTVPGGLSEELSDLLLSCLKRNPSDRPPSTTLLAHPWFSSFEILEESGSVSTGQSVELPSEAKDDSVRSLQRFSLKPQVKEELMCELQEQGMTQSFKAVDPENPLELSVSGGAGSEIGSPAPGSPVVRERKCFDGGPLKDSSASIDSHTVAYSSASASHSPTLPQRKTEVELVAQEKEKPEKEDAKDKE